MWPKYKSTNKQKDEFNIYISVHVHRIWYKDYAFFIYWQFLLPQPLLFNIFDIEFMLLTHSLVLESSNQNFKTCITFLINGQF